MPPFSFLFVSIFFFSLIIRYLINHTNFLCPYSFSPGSQNPISQNPTGVCVDILPYAAPDDIAFLFFFVSSLLSPLLFPFLLLSLLFFSSLTLCVFRSFFLTLAPEFYFQSTLSGNKLVLQSVHSPGINSYHAQSNITVFGIFVFEFFLLFFVFWNNLPYIRDLIFWFWKMHIPLDCLVLTHFQLVWRNKTSLWRMQIRNKWNKRIKNLYRYDGEVGITLLGTEAAILDLSSNQRANVLSFITTNISSILTSFHSYFCFLFPFYCFQFLCCNLIIFIMCFGPNLEFFQNCWEPMLSKLFCSFLVDF